MRNEFWLSAPTSLWERHKQEEITGIARLLSLDAATLPGPFALIVDDDPRVLSMAEQALRGMGFHTLCNANPEEAATIAASILPDLLLTDALMPRLDGRELCRRLKEDEKTAGIRIVVMSSRIEVPSTGTKRSRPSMWTTISTNPSARLFSATPSTT